MNRMSQKIQTTLMNQMILKNLPYLKYRTGLMILNNQRTFLLSST
jgi:hypothetical protein